MEAVAPTDAAMVSSTSNIWDVALRSQGMGVPHLPHGHPCGQVSRRWAGGLPSGRQDRGGEGFHRRGKEEPLGRARALCTDRGCAPSLQQCGRFKFCPLPIKRGHWLCFIIHCKFAFTLRNLSFTNTLLYFSIKFIKRSASKVKTPSTA